MRVSTLPLLLIAALTGIAPCAANAQDGTMGLQNGWLDYVGVGDKPSRPTPKPPGTPPRAQAQTPQRFVDSVYQDLRTRRADSSPRRATIYDPTLLALISAADTAAKARGDDVGAIDFEPLCGCQDRFSTYRTTLLRSEGAAARVRVELGFANAAAHRTLVLVLVKRPNGWRIADVENLPEMPSLKAHLRALAPPAATPPKAQAAARPSPGALRRYIGKYASDRVGSSTFLSNPIVQQRVRAIVPDKIVRDSILTEGGPTSPLELERGWIVYQACRSHDCNNHIVRLEIAPDGSAAKACYFDVPRDDPDYLKLERTRPHYATWYAARGSYQVEGDCTKSDGSGEVPSAAIAEPAAARPPIATLKPFDLALANPAPPLGTAAEWSGVLLSTGGESKTVTVTLNQAGGKLSGAAATRGLLAGLSRSSPVTGKIKDGVCTLKIESNSYKGRCSQAGFWGASSFLGSAEGFALLYTGGADAIARAARARPTQLSYAGTATSPSGYVSRTIFELAQNAGTLSGRNTNDFGYQPATGAMFDGSCVLLSGKTLSIGTCDERGFAGQEYLRVDKPEARLALTAGTAAEQSMRAAIANNRAAIAQTLAQEAALQPPPPPPQVVTAAGRARYLVEPGGGCGPETMLLKGYCFDEVIDAFHRDPAKREMSLVASRFPVPLGARIGRGDYFYVQVTKRDDGSFSAEKRLRGTARVPLPPGCMYQGAGDGGFVIDIAEGRKSAVEVEDYVCR